MECATDIKILFKTTKNKYFKTGNSNILRGIGNMY